MRNCVCVVYDTLSFKSAGLAFTFVVSGCLNKKVKGNVAGSAEYGTAPVVRPLTS